MIDKDKVTEILCISDKFSKNFIDRGASKRRFKALKALS